MLASPVTAIDAAMVIGRSSGRKTIELLNTPILTPCAKKKPRTVPIRPPIAPSRMPSPMNSWMMDWSDAPSALRSPISIFLSVTVAVIVVATQIMVRARTTIVTRRTSACSLVRTVPSDWATRLTRRALTVSTASLIWSAYSLSWSCWAVMESSRISSPPSSPVSCARSSSDM